jgi:two-component system, chemotaxis family, sensor kinase CheA
VNDPLNDPSPDNQSNDLSQYLQMYVDETEEQLDDLVETMLALEESSDNVNLLVNAFRLLHSMKGAAGMMGFDQITVLTHHLESRFERLRSGRIRLDQVTMSLTLRSIDFLRQCNERLREGSELPTPDTLLTELHQLEDIAEDRVRSELEHAIARPSDLVSPTVVENEPEPESDDDDATEANESAGAYLHVAVLFDQSVPINAELLLRVVSRVETLGRVEATRPTLDMVDSLDPPSTLDVIVFTDVDPLPLASGLEMVGIASVEVRVPRDESAEPLARLVFSTDHEIVPEREQKREEKQTTAPEREPEAVSLQPPSTPASTSRATPTMPLSESAVSEAKATASEAATPRVQETMRVDIDRLDDLMNLAGELIVSHAQFTQVAKDLGGELRRPSASSRARELQDSLRRVISRLRSADESASLGQDWNALVQELEVGLDSLQQQQQILDDSRRMFGRLDEAVDNLSRVSSALQRGVLGTRMVPIGPLFNRFKRVIRDLAVERNKEVILILEGDQTELDKRMIDAIGDPLVHLVRNSIDHGLESTEARIAAGKPPEGMITLSAQHRGNHVYIQVRDDGGGINDEKIRRKVIERGLLGADAAGAMTRQEAIDFIWHPGFSTADTLTSVSGRGVGMDIVRSRIGQLGGSVEVISEVGVGTTFTLKLPLTLAIISSLLVKIRDIVFTIPKDDVREIVEVPISSIVTVHGKQTFSVRGQYIPLLTVDGLFRWNLRQTAINGCREDGVANDVANVLPSSAVPKQQQIVILQSSGRVMGLSVDRAIGTQDVVIKSLTENLSGVEGLAGASILGDGSVSLMLDVAELLKMATAERLRSLQTRRDE